MPAEIRPLTRSSSHEGHSDGLVCVSMTSKYRLTCEENPGFKLTPFRSDWYANQNLRQFGAVTSLADLDISVYWRDFSKAIWKSGLTGKILEFLLSYSQHGNLLGACNEFGITRERGRKLIDFVWRANAENQEEA